MKRWNNFFTIVFFSHKIFSQNISMPQMPNVSAPKMPTIDSPSISKSGEFYHPNVENFYKGAKIEKSSTSNKNEKSLDSQKTTNEVSSELLKTISLQNFFPTAFDLQTLSETENFLKISSLLSNTESSDLKKFLDEKNFSQNIFSDSNLLPKILFELSKLKSKVESQNSFPQEKKSKKSLAKILRFSANQKDLLESCKTIYFSDKESDGTFLLTADRFFLDGGKNFSETFYMLFKSVNSKNAQTIYSVSVMLAQSDENFSSPLFALSKKNDLVAMRTGNLISMTTSDSDFNFDLLLDAGD